MKIAVLSGKGGTGKTFVSVNLAKVEGTATYLDCDVEEPNGRLFLKPEKIKQEAVFKLVPVFDEEKCINCRKCIDFCHFNAIAVIGKNHKVFPEVCHSCGGCSIVCPSGAISEIKRPIGVVEAGTQKDITVVTGILNLGEASGIEVIKSTLEHAALSDELTVIDCPPGSACSVMESIQTADYCLLVAEPTAFGLHNFKMVFELVHLLGKPCGVIVNKCESNTTLIDAYCEQYGISVLTHILYSPNLALEGARANVAVEKSEELKKQFLDVLTKIRRQVVC